MIVASSSGSLEDCIAGNFSKSLEAPRNWLGAFDFRFTCTVAAACFATLVGFVSWLSCLSRTGVVAGAQAFDTYRITVLLGYSSPYLT